MLKLSGYLRGRSLSANGLIHLPGWGDFQMLQIDAPTDPHPLGQRLANEARKRAHQVRVTHITTMFTATISVEIMFPFFL